jgi:hypothetical protein
MTYSGDVSATLTFDTNKIRAAMECVATGKNEPRFYLKGVLLEITACGDIHFVSTDGERMFFGRISGAMAKWEDGKIEGPRRFILPYDGLKEALKHKRPNTWIKFLGEDIFVINGITCMAIAGHFPDWRNVVTSAFENINAECPPMDWGRVATVEKALREWSGNKTATVRVHGKGDGVGALVTGDDHNAFALVMPQKKAEITPIITPNFPEVYEEKTACEKV